MSGIKVLRRLQLGQEATSGTPVAATARWRGMGVPDDQRKLQFVEEEVASLAGFDRTQIPELLAAFSFLPTPMTFQQLPYILNAGVKLVTTGVADGAGSGKIYAFPFPHTAKNTIKTFTIEGGDDQEEEEAEYCFVTDLKLTGKAREAWMMSAEWLGRRIQASTFTGALTAPVLESCLFGLTKLYIDNVGSAFGTTQKSNAMIAADLSAKTGWHPKFTADGQLYFSFAEAGMVEVLLALTFVHNGTATAEKANWRTETPRRIQVKVEGTNLTSAGTTYSKFTVLINLAGKWEKFGKIGEEDGNDIVTGAFRGRPTVSVTDFAEITVVNQDATLP